jgi:hypothetical protein
MDLTPADREALRRAKDLLENPGLAARVSNLIGMPLEKAFELLPERWSDAVTTATRRSLDTALTVAMNTLDSRSLRSTDRLHKLAVAATGAGGGALGLVGLPLELPVSTTLMLRSIAEIARNEGEVLDRPEARLACLEVFALGGRSGSDDAAESSYFLVRAALARSITEAAQYVAHRSVVDQAAPALVRFIAQLTSRFGVTVSQKVAAQAVPVIGAAGGAAINVMFIDHFQDMARGHFTVRRLERIYSPAVVKAEYERL